MEVCLESIKEEVRKRVNESIRDKESFTGSDETYDILEKLKDVALEFIHSCLILSSIQTTDDVEDCIEEGVIKVMRILRATVDNMI